MQRVYCGVPLGKTLYSRTASLWELMNLMLGVDLASDRVTSHPCVSRNTPSCLMPQLWPNGPLGLYADITYVPT